MSHTCQLVLVSADANEASVGRALGPGCAGQRAWGGGKESRSPRREVGGCLGPASRGRADVRWVRGSCVPDITRPEARDAAQVLSVSVLPPPTTCSPGPALAEDRSAGRGWPGGEGLVRAWSRSGAHSQPWGIKSGQGLECGMSSGRTAGTFEIEGSSAWGPARLGLVASAFWGWRRHTLVGWWAAGHPLPSWVGLLWGHTAFPLALLLPCHCL